MQLTIQQTSDEPIMRRRSRWPLSSLTVGTHFIVTERSQHHACRSAVARFNKHYNGNLHTVILSDGSLQVYRPGVAEAIQRPTEQEWIAYCNSMSPCQTVTLKADNQPRFARLASLLSSELFEIVTTDETMSVTHR